MLLTGLARHQAMRGDFDEALIGMTGLTVVLVSGGGEFHIVSLACVIGGAL